ncbi:MAG: molybdopterin-dependent oxidoreductase [Pseudobdellovibrionaceae bacterium]
MAKDQINEKFVKSKTDLARIRAEKKQGIQTSLEIMGSGPLNRDGVPSLPPDQREVKNWPVLDLGVHPEIELKDWKLEIKGLVQSPKIWTWEDLQKLPQVQDQSDFHCVTGWSQLGIHWRGVRFSDLALACGVSPEARFVLTTASDGYSTNLSLTEAMKEDVLLVYEANGKPLPKEHGGPIRMITPQLWAWKGAKWISGIEFLAENHPGFWEVRGYSNTAIPWLNDRYTADEQEED